VEKKRRVKGEKSITMSTRAEILKHIVGKTIAGIVIRESKGAGPRGQLFMIFTDNTYLEFYGDVEWSSHLEVGDLETVKQYANQLGGNVEVVS
jgi:hypothetical protein